MNSMNSVLFRTGNWQWQWEVLSLVTLVPCDLARCVPIQKKYVQQQGRDWWKAQRSKVLIWIKITNFKMTNGAAHGGALHLKICFGESCSLPIGTLS